MPDRSRPDRDLRPEIDELGRVYLDALAWRGRRARDWQLVRLRTQLGTILALLGWRPDDVAVPMLPGPGADP